MPHPILDEAALGALFTPADQRTPEQSARVALDDALIAEIQAADAIVLGVPMYNFGVPAPLKNWIDAISRAGVTFRYTEKGPEGLLKGKTVYVALTRGGKYRNTPADTQVPYLQTVFTFLGMTDVHFVYAEGLAMGPDAEAEGDRLGLRADRGSGGGVTQRTGPGFEISGHAAKFTPDPQGECNDDDAHKSRNRVGDAAARRSSG